MSKRINQRNLSNGTVVTRTGGDPRGTLPNFDVRVVSPPRHFKKPTSMIVEYEDFNGTYELELDGRQARTLYRVLSEHFDELDF